MNFLANITVKKWNTMANMAIPTQNKAGKVLIISKPTMMTISAQFAHQCDHQAKAPLNTWQTRFSISIAPKALQCQ